ncbi:phage tail tip lysozyme [Burkholderia anthina]|uniref:phage tail tip lysozyme n=1 Tax=Burkholderia anthina TaxID=179879 RepID=UPI00158A54BC|nr:phage tail tip lysozyme [Burkholderia anthina]
MITITIQGSAPTTRSDPTSDASSPDNPGTQQIAQIIQALMAELKNLLSGQGNDDSSSSPVGGAGSSPSPLANDNALPQNDPSQSTGPNNGPALNLRRASPASTGSGDPGNQVNPNNGPQSTGQSTSTLPANTGGNAANAIADDLRSRYGLNDTQIAGALGNLKQESNLEPDVNQGGVEGGPSGNFADDNANGWGLAQWGGSRKQGEIAYANQHHLDPGSLDANIGFMNQELDGPYSQTISDLKNSTSVEQATQVWDADYEQATDPQMGNRLQYARNFEGEGL